MLTGAGQLNNQIGSCSAVSRRVSMRYLHMWSAICLLMIVGCGMTPQERLVGTWCLGDVTLEFAKDGTVYDHKKSGIERFGKWQVDGNTLQVEIDEEAFRRIEALRKEVDGDKYMPLSRIYRKTFSVSGDELTLTSQDGASDKWRRKK